MAYRLIYRNSLALSEKILVMSTRRVSNKIWLLLLTSLTLFFEVNADSIDLYPKLNGFGLRPPDVSNPAQVGPVYSQTESNPAWVISQWNIAGERLSAFQSKIVDNVKVYEATAPAASVRVVESESGSEVWLSQNGASVPCSTKSGAPRESDLFISSSTHAVGVSPGVASGYYLSALNSVRELVTISLDARAAEPLKGCKLSSGGAVIAIVLQNYETSPHQTFFYQLHLNRYCAPGNPGGACSAEWLKPLYYTANNPFGCDDLLSSVGISLLVNNESRNLNIELLERLKLAITGSPKNMDHDISHWRLSGGYIGLISWGDVILNSSWKDYRLIVDTK